MRGRFARQWYMDDKASNEDWVELADPAHLPLDNPGSGMRCGSEGVRGRCGEAFAGHPWNEGILGQAYGSEHTMLARERSAAPT